MAAPLTIGAGGTLVKRHDAGLLKTCCSEIAQHQRQHTCGVHSWLLAAVACAVCVTRLTSYTGQPANAPPPAPTCSWSVLQLFSHPQLLSDAAPSLPNVSRLRLVNAGARGADAAALANALLQLRSLRVLQLHQVGLKACNTVLETAGRLLTAAEPTDRQLCLVVSHLRLEGAGCAATEVLGVGPHLQGLTEGCVSRAVCRWCWTSEVLLL